MMPNSDETLLLLTLRPTQLGQPASMFMQLTGHTLAASMGDRPMLHVVTVVMSMQHLSLGGLSRPNAFPKVRIF